MTTTRRAPASNRADIRPFVVTMSAAAILLVGLLIARPWTRLLGMKAACQLSCEPAFMATAGWATIAAAAPLMLLLLTRPPRTRRTKQFGYGALTVVTVFALTHFPVRWDTQDELLTGAGAVNAFTVGVFAAAGATLVSAVGLGAAIGLTELVNKSRRRRGHPLLAPADVCWPLVGFAVVSAGAALVIAQQLT